MRESLPWVVVICSMAGPSYPEEGNGVVVTRSGPSDETVEMNRLREMAKEEQAWEMLDTFTVRLKTCVPSHGSKKAVSRSLSDKR